MPHPRSGPEGGWGGRPSQVWMGEVPHLRSDGGGTPIPSPDGGTHPADGGPSIQDQDRGGIHQGLDGVHPAPPAPQFPLSIASTCYAAGGMPLAFTQENLLPLFMTASFKSFHFFPQDERTENLTEGRIHLHIGWCDLV